MKNSYKSDSNIQLLTIEDGKYYIKIKNVDIPISLNEYLCNKWVKESIDTVKVQSRKG